MAGDSEIITQDEIEELLRQAQAAAQGIIASSPSEPARTTTEGPVSSVDQNEIEAMLNAGSKTTTAGHELGQGDIEALLRTNENAAKAGRATSSTTASPPKTSHKPTVRTATDDISFLLSQAEEALASVDQPHRNDLPGLAPFQLHEFGGTPASSEKATLELLSDVELDVKIELGRTHMHLEEILKLRRGSVVLLDKLAGDPVEIYVNERLVARGEVLVLNDNFCVRVAELIAGEEPKAA
jgi:flagellar motor switch protein FliN/FliY